MNAIYTIIAASCLFSIQTVVAQVKVYTTSGIATAVNEQAWRVQIETVENLPLDRYYKLPPVIQDRLYATSINTGQLVVFAGDYYMPKDAEDAQRIIVGMGYRDAFVVRFNLQDKLGGFQTQKIANENPNKQAETTNSLESKQRSNLPDNVQLVAERTTMRSYTPKQIALDQVESSQVAPEPESKPIQHNTTSNDIATTVNSIIGRAAEPSIENASATPNPATEPVTETTTEPVTETTTESATETIADLYFVQLGLFQYAFDQKHFQKLAHINNILTTLTQHGGNTVTQVVMGPFNSDETAQVAAKMANVQGFNTHITKFSYPIKQIEALSPQENNFLQFRYLYKKK
jgi:cell division protein FtsN